MLRPDRSALVGPALEACAKQVYRLGDTSWGVFSMQTLTRTPEFRQATL